MRDSGAFGFRFKEQDYVIRDLADASPNVLGVNFCSFLNKYINTNNLIEMVSRFTIKPAEVLLTDVDKREVLSIIKKCSKKFKEEGIEDDWTNKTFNLVNQSFKGDYEISWKVFSSYLYSGKNKFEYLMGLGILSSDELVGRALIEPSLCKWAYIANLDSKCLEIYRASNQSDFSFEGRYVAPTDYAHLKNIMKSGVAVTLIDSMGFDKISYYFDDAQDYFYNLGDHPNEIKKVVNKFHLEVSLNKPNIVKNKNKI